MKWWPFGSWTRVRFVIYVNFFISNRSVLAFGFFSILSLTREPYVSKKWCHFVNNKPYFILFDDNDNHLNKLSKKTWYLNSSGRQETCRTHKKCMTSLKFHFICICLHITSWDWGAWIYYIWFCKEAALHTVFF